MNNKHQFEPNNMQPSKLLSVLQADQTHGIA
jgi:hypothetical protein